MTRFWIPFFAGALALLVIIPAAARPAAPLSHAPLPAARASVDAIYSVTDTQAAAMEQAGVQIVRLLLSWAQTERVRTDPRSYDWTLTDTALQRLAGRHLDVILTIRDNPAWAAHEPNGPVDIAPIQDYYDFLAAAGARYGRAPYTVRIWEIYNEEDGAQNFGNRAAEYAGVLRQAATILKTFAPAAPVVMGGLAYDCFDICGFVRTFLRDFLAAGGGAATDAINFHSYSNSGWGSLAATVASLRATMAQAGVDAPLIWTEGGMSSNPAYGGSPGAQAAYVAKVYAGAQAQGVSFMTWFPWQDFTNPAYWYFQNHGLFTLDGAPKLAYTAYAVATRYLTSTTFLRAQTPDELGGAPNAEGYYFQRPGGGRLVVAWANEGTATETWPVLEVQAVRDALGAAVEYEISGGQAVIPLGDNPIYVELAPPAGSPTAGPTQTAVASHSATAVASRSATARPTRTAAASRSATPAPPTRPPASPPPGASPVTSPSPCGPAFSDIQPDDYFYEPARDLLCQGALSGYADGTFRPYNGATRAQTSKIIALAMQWPSEPGVRQIFADVSAQSPFYAVIQTAAARGIISGLACGGPGQPCDSLNRPYFRPYAEITRGQLSKLLALARGWAGPGPAAPHFADVPPGHPFFAYIEAVYARGVVSGYADGAFRPALPVTRGQLAKMIHQAAREP